MIRGRWWATNGTLAPTGASKLDGTMAPRAAKQRAPASRARPRAPTPHEQRPQGQSEPHQQPCLDQDAVRNVEEVRTSHRPGVQCHHQEAVESSEPGLLRSPSSETSGRAGSHPSLPGSNVGIKILFFVGDSMQVMLGAKSGSESMLSKHGWLFPLCRVVPGWCLTGIPF